VESIGRSKAVWLFGARVAENHLGQRSSDRINRPDIWMQAIRSDQKKLLWHGGRPHMDSGLVALRRPGMTSGKISAAANRSAALFARRANHLRNWRDVRLACPHLPIHARLPPKRNAPKNSFRKPAQTDQAIQPGCEKYFAFVFSEIDVS
jgi:hypothetical protein